MKILRAQTVKINNTWYPFKEEIPDTQRYAKLQVLSSASTALAMWLWVAPIEKWILLSDALNGGLHCALRWPMEVTMYSSELRPPEGFMLSLSLLKTCPDLTWAWACMLADERHVEHEWVFAVETVLNQPVPGNQAALHKHLTAQLKAEPPVKTNASRQLTESRGK